MTTSKLTRQIHGVQFQDFGKAVYTSDNDERSEQENTCHGEALSCPDVQMPYMVQRHQQNCCICGDIWNSIADVDSSQI